MENIDYINPVIADINMSNMTVSLHNGSVIQFKSGDKPNSLRGRKINMAILDEAAFIKPEIWQVIRPELADSRGSATLISTPNGIGDWFHKIWNADNDWSKYYWPSYMNSEIMTAEELSDISNNMSQTEYDQEILAKFITKAGRVYTDFTEDTIISEFILDTSRHDVFLGLDFGYAAPTAVCFMAVDRASNDKIVQFDEIYVMRTQIFDIISLIKEKLSQYDLDIDDLKACYCDPAGEAYELSSGTSPVDEMRRAGFTVINKPARIVPGIAQVRAYIKTVTGLRRYFVLSNCAETIRSFNGYMYDISQTGVAKEEALKDGLHDHMCDAVRYFFVNKFDTVKYVAKNLKHNSYLAVEKKKNWKVCSKCKRPFMSTTPKLQPPFMCNSCLSEEI